jgi:hypothetical protein
MAHPELAAKPGHKTHPTKERSSLMLSHATINQESRRERELGIADPYRQTRHALIRFRDVTIWLRMTASTPSRRH